MRSRSSPALLGLAALLVLGLAWLAVDLSGEGSGADGVGPARVLEHEDAGARTEVASLVEPAVGTDVASNSEVAQGAPLQREAAPATGVGLEGRVVSLDGELDLAAVRVALWAERTDPTCDQFDAAGPRGRVMRLVHAASDGTFAIEDLDPATRYHLRAGGGGRASLWLSDPVEPGGEPVTLELARVKGLRVELVGLDGKPPRTPPGFMEDAFVLSGSEVNRRGARLEPWEQDLLGLSGMGCDSDPSPHAQLLVLSGSPSQPTIGPITCYADLPGYEDAQPTYWAQLVTDHIPTEKLVLRPSTPGWGSIEVELAGLSDVLRGHFAKDEPIGTLNIEFEDSSSYTTKLYGADPLRRLEGLPFGEARWAFESFDARCKRPLEGSPVPFRIGDRLGRITIDLSLTGAVRVELDPACASEAAGLHHVTLTRGDGTPVSIPARQLPRLFLLVESGVWQQASVGFQDPNNGAMTLRELGDGPTVRIEPGAIATLRVTTGGAVPELRGR